LRIFDKTAGPRDTIGSWRLGGDVKNFLQAAEKNTMDSINFEIPKP